MEKIAIYGTFICLRKYVNLWTFVNPENWLVDKNWLFPCLIVLYLKSRSTQKWKFVTRWILCHLFSFSLKVFLINVWIWSEKGGQHFLLYTDLWHLHRQEMELLTSVFYSFHFCHLFINPCWGRIYVLFKLFHYT